MGVTRDNILFVFKLDLFFKEEATEFLNHQLSEIEKSNSSVDDLVEMLQSLQLALHQTVSYIYNKHLTYQSFGEIK